MNLFKYLKFYLSILFLIVALGIFLRSYNFSDWMHFELDQSRDARLISNAYEKGPGELPLLGPRARGSFLRLGPSFYYFEYLSAKVFGNTPPGMAKSVLIFSILSLPLFYLLCRRYFGNKISLISLFIFSISLFMIMYSRFAWNPNPLPFFALLFIYSILRAVDLDDKKKGVWLVVALGSLSIATQMHFLALIAFPAIAASFLLLRRPKIKLRFWMIGVSLAVIFYIPMIINEVKTSGDNGKEFVKVVTERSEGGESSIFKKAVISYLENSNNYFLILSGKNSSGIVVSGADETKEISLPIKKTYSVQYIENYLVAFLGIVFFSMGILLLAFYLVKEKNSAKKDFLIIVLLWFIATFGIFTLLAFDLSPRFFLLSAPIPFIFFGFFIKYLYSFHKFSTYLISFAVAVLAFSNGNAIKNRFYELANAGTKPIPISEDPIIKERARVTFGQEKKIVEYMESFYFENKYPIFYSADSQYNPAFKYLLQQDRINFDELNMKRIYEKGNYFLIKVTKEYEQDLGEYQSKYYDLETKQFGTLTVFRIYPKKEAITAIEKDFSQPEKKANSKAPKRYKWGEIFGRLVAEDDDDE
ncbi:MAG: glycosyltransferase family 39 protein [Patescibacteria group bacterium]